MKISKLVTVISLSLAPFTVAKSAFSYEVPATPPEPCYNNSCNETMSQLYSDFLLLGKTPNLAPAVYSGTCRHLGMYSPDRDHHAVVLLDQNPQTATPLLETARFSAILAYFAETNEYAGWDLATARMEMQSSCGGSMLPTGITQDPELAMETV